MHRPLRPSPPGLAGGPQRPGWVPPNFGITGGDYDRLPMPFFGAGPGAYPGFGGGAGNMFNPRGTGTMGPIPGQLPQQPPMFPPGGAGGAAGGGSRPRYGFDPDTEGSSGGMGLQQGPRGPGLNGVLGLGSGGRRRGDNFRLF